jgi:hypothetical protein
VSRKTLKRGYEDRVPAGQLWRWPVVVIGTIVCFAFFGAVMLTAVAADGNGNQADKAAVAQREQQGLAAARAQSGLHPKPRLSAKPDIPDAAAPVRTAGIVDMHQGPFSSSTFVVSNFWQGPVGSTWFLVYAGADGGSGTGAVRLYTESPDMVLTYLGTYAPPGGGGDLTVVSVDGPTLHLKSSGGQVLVFNLVHETYG